MELFLGGGSTTNPNETVNIFLTQIGGSSADLIGASVTIADDDSGDTLLTATWNGSTITTEIDVNTNYTVSVGTISGYLDCPYQSYQAGYQTERAITFNYQALGVYIEATDHTLYTSSNWSSSGKTANSIVIISENVSFRLALTESSSALPIHKNFSDPIETYLAVPTTTPYYGGKLDTDKIVAFNTAYGSNTISYAAPWVKNFTFPDGSKNCYMPATGHCSLLYNNKTAINN